MSVKAVERNIQFAIIKPLEKRMVAFIQHPGEWLMPNDVFPRQPAPEPGQVFFGFGAERLVSFDAGTRWPALQSPGRAEIPGFHAKWI